MNKFYTGCVEDRNDPLKLGRCQVRIVGLHTEDKTILPTKDLPWAFPVTPITSAGISGIGTTPLGPVEGSWVLIMFMDADEQMPIMMGTLGGISQIPNAKDDPGTIQVDKVDPDGFINPSAGDEPLSGGATAESLQDGKVYTPEEIIGPLAKLIANGESGSAAYDAFNRGSNAPKGSGSAGGESMILTDMSIRQIMDKQSLQPGSADRLFAVGKYQCIPSTLQAACQKLNIDVDQTFSPTIQDIICQEYLVARKRDRLMAYYSSPDKNNETLLKGAGQALAMEFASIEDPFFPGFPYGGEFGTYYKNKNRVKTDAASVRSALLEEWDFRNNPKTPSPTRTLADGHKVDKGTDYIGVQKLVPKDDSKLTPVTPGTEGTAGSGGGGFGAIIGAALPDLGFGDILGDLGGDLIGDLGGDLFGDLDFESLGLDFGGLTDLGLGDLADLGLGDLGDLGSLGGILGDMGLDGLVNLNTDLVSVFTDFQSSLTELTGSFNLDGPLNNILGATGGGGLNLNGIINQATGMNVNGLDVNSLVAKATGLNVNNLNVNSLVANATGGFNLNNLTGGSTGGFNLNSLTGIASGGFNVNNIIGQATQGLNVNNLVANATGGFNLNSLTDGLDLNNLTGGGFNLNSLTGGGFNLNGITNGGGFDLNSLTGGGFNLNNIIGQSTGLNPSNLLGQFGNSLNQITSKLGIPNISGSVSGLLANLGLANPNSNSIVTELTRIAGSSSGQATAILNRLEVEPTVQLPGVIGETKSDGTVSTGSNVDPNRGFQDPNGQYPRYKNEQDTNRLAHGNNLGRTIVMQKEKAHKTNVPIANGGTWDQAPVPYNAVYPYNKVTQTESGHVLEYDDTPGSERIHVYHKSGTFTETDSTGTQVNRIVGDGYEILERNGFVYVKGALNVSVDGALNLRTDNIFNLEVSGAATINIYNNANINVSGDSNLAVGGTFNLKANKINMESVGQFNINAGTGLNIQSGKDMNIYSEGSVHVEADSDIHNKATGGIFTETDEDLSIKAGKGIFLQSEEDSSIKAGMSIFLQTDEDLNLKADKSIKIDADGDTSITGMRVNAAATTNLNLKGNVFATLSSAIAVDIKSSGLLNLDGSLINLNNGIATGAGSGTAAAAAKAAKKAKAAKPAGQADIEIPIQTRGTSGIIAYPKLSAPTRSSETAFETPDSNSNADLATYRANRVSNNETTSAGITSDTFAKDVAKPSGTSSGSVIVNVNAIKNISTDSLNAGMRLSKNWTLGELTTGGTRIPRMSYTLPAGKDGLPGRTMTPQDIVSNLKILCDNILEPITEKYGKDAFTITSCFRRPYGNSQNEPGDLRVKDKDGNWMKEGGDHGRGSAVDITFKTKARTYEVCKELPKLLGGWNQIIMEYDKGGSSYWIHCSIRETGNNGHCFSMNNHKICVAGVNSGFVLI